MNFHTKIIIPQMFQESIALFFAIQGNIYFVNTLGERGVWFILGSKPNGNVTK